MKVEDGTIVKFLQQYSSAIHGHWGRLQREVLFPSDVIAKTLENNLRGKSANDTFKLEYPFDDIKFNPELVFQVPRKQLQHEGVKLKKGMVFRVKTPYRFRPFTGVTKEIKKDHVLIDCNSPFLGESLVISSVKILSVRPATKAELEYGFKSTEIVC